MVTVNSTDYAKVTLDGKTVLLDEGAHVFKTNNFSYAVKVAKSTSYIEHGDLLILMPPPNTVGFIILVLNNLLFLIIQLQFKK